MRTIVRAILAALLAAPTSASAMQFSSWYIDPGVAVINAIGPIIPGDSARLLAAVQALPSSDRLGAFVLDSPGGNVFEAEKLAETIHFSGAAVVLSGGSKCVSACFLLFAAGVHRFASDDALVGVHSVSEGGAETLDSMGLTTALARDAAAYGVPAEIIGKLVQTKPGTVEWLTPEDLRLMDVQIAVSIPAPSAPPPPTMTAMAPTVPVPQPPISQQQTSAAFQQGLADRRSYESWFDGLDGEYQAGAFYWSGQRSLRNPGTCYTGSAAFRAGCLAAKQILSPSDARRHAEPDYRAGWNSF